MRPSLEGIPVVVTGSNDGCVIARSEEAKQLSVKMGVPWFQIKHLAEEAGLVCLSANFALYGDLSDRVASLAAHLGTRTEIYSIDESFHDLAHVPGDLVARSHKIRSRILQWVGIPVGVGIGSTKTRAKLANHIAKSAERKPGSYPARLAQVCNLESLSQEELNTTFEATDVGEVWGIGPRISKQLVEGGITSVADLLKVDPGTIRSRFSVVMERTVLELRGTSCLDLEHAPQPRGQIACTRSFGQSITEIHQLAEAVTDFASRAAQKARKQGSLAGQVLVFIHTSPFRQGPQYSRSITVPLRRPSADTSVIVSAVLAGLRTIFRTGYSFAKAGVMLLDLQSMATLQEELDLEDDGREDRTKLMCALDTLNQRYGRGTVLLGSAGLGGPRRQWTMKQERRTPRYTTNWDEIPIVRA